MKKGLHAGGWLSFVFLVVALACLSAGLNAVYLPAALGFAMAVLVLWIAARRFGWSWAPGLILASCAAAGSAGLLLARAAIPWMLGCLIFALAAFEMWDAESGVGNTMEFRRLFEQKRGLILGAVLIAGTLTAFFAGQLNFQAPFGGLGLAALAVLFGLYRLNNLFKE